jgi:hypothetical protein
MHGTQKRLPVADPFAHGDVFFSLAGSQGMD